ncbi:hypothetical protein AVEN_439-1 [Araneus ventricosus]|uniref:Uncharacterized protein n=1 Tax=Araneus ventricosus TaxID=182803 RepID=A0A4Y2IXA9_ARAVE|nr:hypothetical protein AVEN_439-1 [Araneus ventricosus]
MLDYWRDGIDEVSAGLNLLVYSLVILTSRIEATREILWDGPRNFEPLSVDDDDTNLSTDFHANPMAGLATGGM